MKNKIINKIFIYAFLFLYALVAFISFCHAIEFFDIGNTHWMSIMLAFAFELGLAVCLASILIGTNKKNNITWVLLTILVLVQVIGNTYSVFKYISESGADYYTYLAKPMLFFIQEVSEETVQIIISWIMGAILPIVALLMTEMVANGIKENQSLDVEKNDKKDEVSINIDDNKEDILNSDFNKKLENDITEKIVIVPNINEMPQVKGKSEIVNNFVNDNIIDENIEDSSEGIINNPVIEEHNDVIEEQSVIEEHNDVIEEQSVIEEQEKLEDVTPFEKENVIVPEETTVNIEETQKNDDCFEKHNQNEFNEDTSKTEYGLSNKNHKKFIAIDDKEIK